MAEPVEVEWSVDALADLDRFAAFLHSQVPELAGRVASELVGSSCWRCWGGISALQYRYDGSFVLMLRVFHSRELR